MKKELPSTSSSALIPISPFIALLRSEMDLDIMLIKILNLSSSCRSTTYVGEGTSNAFLMLYSSNGVGRVLSLMSSAI